LTTLGTVAALMLASVLMLAATAKASTFGRTVATIEKILVSAPRFPQLIGAGVVAIEWTAGASIAAAPSTLYAQATSALLFTVFAAFGIRAIVLRQKVDCACFGPLMSRRLGWLQVAQLPIVYALLATIAYTHPKPSSQRGLAILAIQIAVGVILFAAALPSWTRVRRERLAFLDADRYRVSDSTVRAEGRE
jgi:hypothetical protein